MPSRWWLAIPLVVSAFGSGTQSPPRSGHIAITRVTEFEMVPSDSELLRGGSSPDLELLAVSRPITFNERDSISAVECQEFLCTERPASAHRSTLVVNDARADWGALDVTPNYDPLSRVPGQQIRLIRCS
jgi:hypothetical protein